MPERVQLPDGTYIDIPDDASVEYRNELQKQLNEQFYGFGDSDIPDSRYTGGIGGLTPSSATSSVPVGEGTMLGAAWEGIKSIPRGLRQFGLMAAQGYEGLKTPDEDTDREKDLRQRMDDLMMEIDPRYRDSNLVNVGMGLGQVGGMIGLSAGAGFLGAGTAVSMGIAGTATALMGAGEQAGRIAEFEEATGEDVSGGKEMAAMGMGLGIGLSEVLLGPAAKFGKAMGIARKTGAPLKTVLADSAENVVQGGLVKSVLRQVAEEGIQEGSAGFGQALTARALYNDEALENAGADAFKEALIGGQVGGAVELISRGLARSFGGPMAGKIDRRMRRELLKGMEKKMAAGEMDTKMIDDMFDELDVEGGSYQQDLRDSIVEFDAETDEWVLREDDQTLWARNDRIFEKEVEKLEQSLDDGEIDWDTYQEKTTELAGKGNLFKTQMLEIVAGYNAQHKGRLGQGALPPSEATPVDQQAPDAPAVVDDVSINEVPNAGDVAPQVDTEIRDVAEVMESVLSEGEQDSDARSREEVQERISAERQAQKRRRQEINDKQVEVDDAQNEVNEKNKVEERQKTDEVLEVTPELTLTKGSLVTHPEFGSGVIVEEEAGPSMEVPVEDADGNIVRRNGEPVMQSRFKGKRIVHEQFGEGTVLDVSKKNRNTIEVVFDNPGMDADGKPIPPNKKMRSNTLSDVETNESMQAMIQQSHSGGRLFVQFGQGPDAVFKAINRWAGAGNKSEQALKKEIDELGPKIETSEANVTELVDKHRTTLDRNIIAEMSTIKRKAQVLRDKRKKKEAAALEKKLPHLKRLQATKTKVIKAQTDLTDLKRRKQSAQDQIQGGFVQALEPRKQQVQAKQAQINTNEKVASLRLQIQQIINGPYRGKATERAIKKAERELEELQVEQEKLTEAFKDQPEEVLTDEQYALAQTEVKLTKTEQKLGKEKQAEKKAEKYLAAINKAVAAIPAQIEANLQKIQNKQEQVARLSSTRQTSLTEVIQIMDESGFTAKQQAGTIVGDVNITPKSKLNKKGQELAQALGLDETTMVARIAQFREAKVLRTAFEKDIKTLEGEINKEDPQIKLTERTTELEALKAEQQNAEETNILTELDMVSTLASLEDSKINERAVRQITKLKMAQEKTLKLEDMAERLTTRAQRNALAELIERVKANKTEAMSPAAVKALVDRILKGGVNVRQVRLTEFSDVKSEKQTLPANKQKARIKERELTKREATEEQIASAKNLESGPFRKDVEQEKLRRQEQRLQVEEEAGADAIRKVLYHTLGIGSLIEVSKGLEQSGSFDKPAPSSWVGASFGILGDVRFKKFAEKLRKQKFNVVPENILEVMELKGFNMPFKNTGEFMASDFFTDLVASTVGSMVADVTPKQRAGRWNKLDEGEKHAILARVLNTPDQTYNKATSEQRVQQEEVIVNRVEIEQGQIADLKTKEQKDAEAKGIKESQARFNLFKAAVQKRFRKLGITAMPQFVADVDSAFAQLKDVVANGAFEYELDPDTGKVLTDDNGKPTLKLDAQGNPIYRPGYEGGAVASLQKYGTRIMFNLSQITEQYGPDWHNNIDSIVKDIAVHEGSHIHFLRDVMNETERKTLEAFGKKEGYVPKEVNAEAHKKKMTWRQYVSEVLPYDLAGPALTEEVSVHILDALAKGQLAPNKTAGLIGKIKRTQFGIFSSIFQSAADADLAPVMQVFERIQNVDAMKERQKNRDANRGMASLRFVERANPDDIRALREAVKENDPAKIDAAVDKILLSKEEFSDTRTGLERLQESLWSELRARKEVELNPSNAYAPVLNAKAIEAGEISAESLNAYFRFQDGREPPFRMPTGDADLKLFRTGKPQIAISEHQRVFDERVANQKITTDSGVAPGQALVEALEEHNKYLDSKGLPQFVGTVQEFEQMINTSAKEGMAQRLFDQRIPQWKSSYRAMAKRLGRSEAELRAEVGGYESSLKMLSDQIAISAWRWADNAMNFVGMIKHTGPLQYKDGGLTLMEDALGRDGETPVKGLDAIIAPLLDVEGGERMASDYMTALRIHDVWKMYNLAKTALSTAEQAGNIDEVNIRRRDLQEWAALYDATNPVHTKGPNKGLRFLPESNTTNDAGQEVLGFQEIINHYRDGTAEEQMLVVQFAEEWADLNAHMVQLSVDMGQLSQERGDIMKAMAYIPFYRDQGWDKSNDFTNPNNENVEKSNKEAANDTPVLRGTHMLGKHIVGSTAQMDGNLFANLEKNIAALVRDGTTNVAITRTMRDEVANGTGIELLPEPTETELAREEFLKEDIKAKTKELKGSTPSEQARLNSEIALNTAELEVLSQTIIEKKEAFKKQRDELTDLGFAPIEIIAHGISTPVGYKVDAEGNPVLDAEGKPIPEKSVIAENGIQKKYRTMDPALSRGIMDIGFNPMQAIEDFFGKTIGIKSERVNKGLAKILVKSSRLLREMVTRSPAFMVKNIIRDGMQAGVIYGGFPDLYFEIAKNIFKPGIVMEAENRGLGISVDQAVDDRGNTTRTSWDSSIPIFGTLWNGLGQLSKRSEVATRMAVYDMTMAKTDGNAAEALTQAIEIMNYGRRGSSRMVATIAAMAPFMNGRIQGLNVMYRSHTGSLDAPGLFATEDGAQLPLDVEKRMRFRQTLARGTFIAMGTLVYFLMMKDDEEYKNAREDMKNDWWLIPLGADKEGKKRIGLKIPIPFEVGLFYKVIPEQLARAVSEKEHDAGDVKEELKRQLKASLFFDLRPQFFRPALDAMSNRDAFQRDTIVPSWMEETVAASEQYNPYTNMVARLVGDQLEKVPMLKDMDFLTSPMKLEYMLRQYTGTIGSYVMTVSDRLARMAMDENIAGTGADFGFSQETFAQMPMLGDLFYNISKGGGYQESLYETMEQLDKIVTTMGQIKQTDPLAAAKYKLDNEDMLKHKNTLAYFDKRMKNYRTQRDAIFQRSDISDDEKRNMLHRMFETRDDMLSDMLRIMAEIREERGLVEQIFGRSK